MQRSKRGRPPKPLDAAKVVEMARLGRSQVEIAQAMGVSQSTVSKRCGPAIELARNGGQSAGD